MVLNFAVNNLEFTVLNDKFTIPFVFAIAFKPGTLFGERILDRNIIRPECAFAGFIESFLLLPQEVISFWFRHRAFLKQGVIPRVIGVLRCGNRKRDAQVEALEGLLIRTGRFLGFRNVFCRMLLRSGLICTGFLVFQNGLKIDFSAIAAAHINVGCARLRW